jgi:hypothetical protein
MKTLDKLSNFFLYELKEINLFYLQYTRSDLIRDTGFDFGTSMQEFDWCKRGLQ